MTLDLNKKQYWLMKSEPETFSIWDLEKQVKPEYWEGVRNYQARNYMQQMRLNDLAFLYHSNCKVPGIYGVMEIVVEAIPDSFALDSTSKYFDKRAVNKNPWVMVGVSHIKTYKEPLALSFLKLHPELCHMKVAQRGNRLSITPVSAEHWDILINEVS